MFLKLFTGRKNVKDPVCGKSLAKPEASNVSYEFVGETYYFCSERCRDRFQALPARYLETSVKVSDSSPSGGCC